MPLQFVSIGWRNRYVRIALYAAISGYSRNAIRMKIKHGVWVECREYIRAPDGCVMVDREVPYMFVENARPWRFVSLDSRFRSTLPPHARPP